MAPVRQLTAAAAVVLFATCSDALDNVRLPGHRYCTCTGSPPPPHPAMLPPPPARCRLDLATG